MAAGVPIPDPPANAARLVQYESAVGKLSAYVTLPPSAGQRHPAIIWISGGDCNTIDDGFFQPSPPDNDQTASAFRQAGVVTMYPSLRGGNRNPGFREGFFGEVDDVLAALDYLGKQEFVDRDRIYLGGHSTGGTLVLLVAQSTNRFRAVFSFGPADDIRGYGPENLPFDLGNPKELELRNPLKWMPAVGCPLFVFEGTDEPGNISALVPIQRASQNPLVHVQAVKGANHFSILAPLTRLIAAKIVADTGPTTTVSFSDAECNSLFGR